ncbi:hypothetical protein ETH_00022180 [Eimeria tenella]|uniref:FF domain-containing protein n=1 Tax=Eimeria tenella TaxID=5802 RepID=U6L4R1_EIMTE|nr:hypothetical protein ETH_00022180 [Eimeria tenella]CDJ45141.1 hypothetical protein ETH_00022180 [Eimeria tenella]|eukprot:XP_013235888.1 hypothetical protein ETH_00022180 [Eimeria tenella]
MQKKRQTLSVLDEAETKKMKLLKADAATAFTNMLVERVKNPYLQSPDGSEWPLELLKGDGRFTTNSLTETEKKELYKAFVREFCASRVSLFASRLSLLPNEDLSLPFDQVLEKVQTAKRLFQGIPEEELRPKQEAWKEQRLEELGEGFILFLRQHPDVSRFVFEKIKKEKSKKENFQKSFSFQIQEEELQPLLDKLKHDVRYQRLDAFPARRLQLIKQRVQELFMEQKRKGPGIAQKQQAAQSSK